MPNLIYPPLIEFTRGGIAESVHCGAIAIVDVLGNIIASYGNPESTIFMRSSAKPLQVLPFVQAGGIEHFGLELEDLALMCGSHSGTPDHTRVASRIQQKISCSENDLLCGVHKPFHRPSAEALRLSGQSPTPNHHNCSGKHSGMLAYARLTNHRIDDYIDLEHPIQQNIIRTLGEMGQCQREEIIIGIDGCSVPNFAVPLHKAALSYAKLCDPGQFSTDRILACRKITIAMTSHPFMVGGPDRFDTRVMEVGGDKIISKAGAEGYQAMGLLTDALRPGSPALGIAIKIADGDISDRARSIVALEVLRQLGAFTPDQLSQLSEYDFKPIYNSRSIEVGEIRPYFALDIKI